MSVVPFRDMDGDDQIIKILFKMIEEHRALLEERRARFELERRVSSLESTGDEVRRLADETRSSLCWSGGRFKAAVVHLKLMKVKHPRDMKHGGLPGYIGNEFMAIAIELGVNEHRSEHQKMDGDWPAWGYSSDVARLWYERNRNRPDRRSWFR